MGKLMTTRYNDILSLKMRALFDEADEDSGNEQSRAFTFDQFVQAIDVNDKEIRRLFCLFYKKVRLQHFINNPCQHFHLHHRHYRRHHRQNTPTPIYTPYGASLGLNSNGRRSRLSRRSPALIGTTAGESLIAGDHSDHDLPHRPILRRLATMLPIDTVEGDVEAFFDGSERFLPPQEDAAAPVFVDEALSERSVGGDSRREEPAQAPARPGRLPATPPPGVISPPLSQSID
ncbi:uncharacterized protein VTP21DRAFT_3953 [Calcarisporiella thermophila]|uniref:uncharacterized protein n=1 Tax=Calcarisporiella thermophila TaxID=911321 RepID=UPI0037431FE5